MNQTPHNPVDRLNDHHADDLLAVARAFAGHPTATTARATHVDARGVDLEIGDPEGKATAHVDFAAPADCTPRSVRCAFRRLATEANAIVADIPTAGRTHD